MTDVKLIPVHRQLADYPELLRQIADKIQLDIPRAGLLLAADRLYEYAADLEHLALAYLKRLP